MSFEEDNGYTKVDNLTHLDLGLVDDDDRELEMEREAERLEALGFYDDEPEDLHYLQPIEDEYPEYFGDDEPEPERVINVTLNGVPVYKDAF